MTPAGCRGIFFTALSSLQTFNSLKSWWAPFFPTWKGTYGWYYICSCRGESRLRLREHVWVSVEPQKTGTHTYRSLMISEDGGPIGLWNLQTVVEVFVTYVKVFLDYIFWGEAMSNKNSRGRQERGVWWGCGAAESRHPDSWLCWEP